MKRAGQTLTLMVGVTLIAVIALCTVVSVVFKPEVGPVSPTSGPTTPGEALATSAVTATLASSPSTSIAPLPTVTAVWTPTSLPASRVTVTEERTERGLYLYMEDAAGQPAGRLGPLARGKYAVGPNDQFLVYVTQDGMVLALTIGKPTFTRIANLKRTLSTAARGVDPEYELAFHDSGYAFTLIIRERVFGQTTSVILPRSLTRYGF